MTRSAYLIGSALLALSSHVHVAAQAISRTCFGSDVCYSLNIPNVTAQSGNGDIFFQISAPVSYQWVALGQGTEMSGSSMFVVYTSGNGQNVTVSTRLGQGHTQPLYTPGPNITLLAGSGVGNGQMVANVQCSNCHSWMGGNMDFTSDNAEWLYAYKFGPAFNSDELDQQISQHDRANTFVWNFAQAKGGNDLNPFTSNSTVVTDSTGNKANLPFGGNTTMGNNIILAHGVLACIAFVALFPIGGIFIRFSSSPGAVRIHAAIQITGWVLWLVAFSLGIYLASQLQAWHNAHPIVGVFLFLALLPQPLSGLLHHRNYAIYGRRTKPSFAHIFIGRSAILIGIINGGHGLNFAGASTQQIVAYSVPATIIALVYIASIIFDVVKQRRRNPPARPGMAGDEFVLNQSYPRPLESRDTNVEQVHEPFPSKF